MNVIFEHSVIDIIHIENESIFIMNLKGTSYGSLIKCLFGFGLYSY